MTGSDDEKQRPDFNKSLAKALRVIECFDADHATMTLSEAARQADISPGSAKRVLSTLEALGYVGLERNRYRLLPKTLKLGYSYLSTQSFISLAQAHLWSLAEKTQFSWSIAVLDGIDSVYLARAHSKQYQSDYIPIGTRLPAYASSVGKVLLSRLDDAALEERVEKASIKQLTRFTTTDKTSMLKLIKEARTKDYAVNDQETAIGLRSIAVPITLNGTAVAALGCSCDVSSISIDDFLQEPLRMLQSEAAEVSSILKATNTNPDQL